MSYSCPRSVSRGAPATLTILVLAAAILGCDSRAPDPASGDGARGGIAVVCAPSLPAGLNPFTSGDQLASDLRLLLFTPLVLYDGAGSFRPYLASQWQWDDQRRRLTIQIREDLRWHDGEPLTARDVAWTVEAAVDRDYGYWSAAALAPVQDVLLLDSHTVEFIFDRPFIADLEPFVTLPILPRHLLDGIPAAEFATADYHRSPVGSGPYRFAGRSPEGLLLFDRNGDFPEDLGQARLDRIAFRAVPEPSTLLIELATQGVDLCVAGSSVAADVRAGQQIRALALEPPSVQVIPLDTRQDPLSDARVRRAISAALRRAELAAVVSPYVSPARSFLPAGSAELDPALGQPDDDSDLAVSLLESAGWTQTDRQAIRRNAAGDPLRFTLVGPQGAENLLTAVQAQLRQVGIDVELRIMEWAAFAATIMDADSRPSAMALSFTPDRNYSPDPRPELHSTGHVNLASYSDPDADALIEQLGSEIDPAERRALYRELQRRVAEDVPTIYTLYVPRVALVGPRLQGVDVDLNGPFATVAAWWIPEGQRRRGR